MSFNRKQMDSKKGKIRNPVARDDNNRGGFHGKSQKAQRTNHRQTLRQVVDIDVLEEEFDEMYDMEYFH